MGLFLGWSWWRDKRERSLCILVESKIFSWAGSDCLWAGEIEPPFCSILSFHFNYVININIIIIIIIITTIIIIIIILNKWQFCNQYTQNISECF
jgi:hypothetical protein